MFNNEFIKKLKQSNVSADTEKTKGRMLEIWKSASKAQQSDILKLAGVARSAVQRAYKTGNVSAKLVVPLAQTMNVSPFYLTGEADKREECTEELLREFLQKNNYGKLLGDAPKPSLRKKSAVKAEKPPKKTKTKKAAAAKAPKAAIAPVVSAPVEVPVEAPVEVLIPDLTEDEMILLMKSIMLRAKSGGKYADLASALKNLLLS